MKCQEKGRYESKRIAEDFKRKRERDNPTLDLRCYRCPDCGLWHLTHVPDKFSKEDGAA